MDFYGRAEELAILRRFRKKSSASLIVIRGRRRIGKSRLTKEFAKAFDHTCILSGIAPTEKTTAASQREEFARQLSQSISTPEVKSDDWGNLFWFMADRFKKGNVLIVLDEITWMGSKDPDFLSKLQYTWDHHFKLNNNLVLILCGSVSAWIENNLIKNTGFVGRVSYDMKLKELPIDICTKFFKNKHSYLSTSEILKILSVTGGIPWYLEHIDMSLTAEENIHNLCFLPGGLLVREFKQIFVDIFGKKSNLYKSIIKKMELGYLNQTEIREAIGLKKSGDVSHYMEDLILSGFLQRDHTWSLQTGAESRYSKYRLSDNYIRFYLKYIEPNMNRIERGDMTQYPLGQLNGWHTILGLQFENLVLNNRDLILNKLNIRKENIVYDNPYFQTQTNRREACQIDYLIQTTSNNIYIIEIKSSKNTIQASVIEQVKEKIRKLNLPKHYTIRPVLIYMNEVDQKIQDSDFFVHLFDYAQLLEDLSH